MLSGVSFVLLHVPQVEAVLPFYTEKLGLEVDQQQEGFAQFKSGERGAVLALANGAGTGDEGTEVWWFVDDANATHEALSGRGVEIATPPTDMPFGRTFTIKDPAGNRLYLLELPRA